MEQKLKARLIELLQVKKSTGFKSTTSIYKLMQSEGFPRPINIGNRTKRWVESEVQDWIDKQITQSRGSV